MESTDATYPLPLLFLHAHHLGLGGGRVVLSLLGLRRPLSLQRLHPLHRLGTRICLALELAC
eukprot:COSAG04_NODE_12722_length_638_cov_0.998145_2_plen_61_part_01